MTVFVFDWLAVRTLLATRTGGIAIRADDGAEVADHIGALADQYAGKPNLVRQDEIDHVGVGLATPSGMIEGGLADGYKLQGFGGRAGDYALSCRR